LFWFGYIYPTLFLQLAHLVGKNLALIGGKRILKNAAAYCGWAQTKKVQQMLKRYRAKKKKINKKT
jgi:hypothetical protein